MEPEPSRLRALVEGPSFRSATLALIVLNALYLGAEATPALDEVHGDHIEAVLVASLWLFVVEILLRIAAHWPQPGAFFRSGWNRFDFVVVALSLLPALGGMPLAVRVLRVLQLLRAFSLSHLLRGFFDADDGEPPRVILFQAAAFLLVFGYAFALGGVFLLGEHDPARWGSLAASAGTLLRALASGEALAALAAVPDARLLLLGLLAPFYAIVLAIVGNAGWQCARIWRGAVKP